nr:hypothetical protein Itr_chr06CG05200 [Ipomoea trifida]
MMKIWMEEFTDEVGSEQAIRKPAGRNMVKEIFTIRQEVALKRSGYEVIVSWVNGGVSEYKDGGNRRLPGGSIRRAFHRSLEYKDPKQTQIPWIFFMLCRGLINQSPRKFIPVFSTTMLAMAYSNTGGKKLD